MEGLQAEQINQSDQFILCFAHKKFSKLLTLPPDFLF